MQYFKKPSISLHILGRILQIESALLLCPLIVALIYRESKSNILIFLALIFLTGVIGFCLARRSIEGEKLYPRDGLLIVALSWILLSFFGSLPFYLSGQIPSFLDAIFETVSGFTTTGSTILEDVTVLDHSLLFWRSLTHLIGGMGVLVLTLAIVPGGNSAAIHLMKAEVPGPSFGKLVAKMRTTARLLYAIYLVMTAVLLLILCLLGMPIFDAFIHAFGAAGTGGFSNMPNSVAAYNSPAITYALAIGMLAFGVNFNLYYLVLIGQFRRALKSEELRAYLAIYLTAVGLIFLNLIAYYKQLGTAFRESFFTVASIMTTTGFSSADFAEWPLFSHVILLILMFIGGSAGSTAGGLKVSRVLIMGKIARREMRLSRQPHRVISVRYDKKALSHQERAVVVNYFIVYILLFILLLLVVALNAPSYDVAFSAVAATFNNIGPGLSIIGPSGSYAGFSALSKIALTISMLFGRLEIFPLLYLFTAWRKS
ncbi:MAG: TrkH family potassium uptake protein [Eubacteriales bacterium]|nr:TrkH family potassium uptake protein [Eubacteriales bacterium]